MNKRIVLILGLFVFFGCERKEEVRMIKEAEIPYEQPKEIPQQEEQKQEVIPTITQTRANPFLTEEEEKTFQVLGKAVPIDYLVLSAILYSPSASKAIINGQILGIGSSIDNKEIIEIQPEAVILKDAQSEYIVRLKKVKGK